MSSRSWKRIFNASYGVGHDVALEIRFRHRLAVRIRVVNVVKRTDIYEGRVAHTPLHTGQIGHMDGGPMRHFLLCQTCPVS